MHHVHGNIIVTWCIMPNNLFLLILVFVGGFMMNPLHMARPALQLSRQSLFPNLQGVSSLQANYSNSAQVAPAVNTGPQNILIPNSTVAETLHAPQNLF